jgi:hypothetical protein
LFYALHIHVLAGYRPLVRRRHHSWQSRHRIYQSVYCSSNSKMRCSRRHRCHSSGSTSSPFAAMASSHSSVVCKLSSAIQVCEIVVAFVVDNEVVSTAVSRSSTCWSLRLATSERSTALAGCLLSRSIRKTFVLGASCVINQRSPLVGRCQRNHGGYRWYVYLA